MQRRAISTVLTLGEALGSNPLQNSEVFVDLDALLEIGEELLALGYFEGSPDSVVVEALGKGALVGEAG